MSGLVGFEVGRHYFCVNGYGHVAFEEKKAEGEVVHGKAINFLSDLKYRVERFYLPVSEGDVEAAVKGVMAGYDLKRGWCGWIRDLFWAVCRYETIDTVARSVLQAWKEKSIYTKAVGGIRKEMFLLWEERDQGEISYRERREQQRERLWPYIETLLGGTTKECRQAVFLAIDHLLRGGYKGEAFELVLGFDFGEEKKMQSLAFSKILERAITGELPSRDHVIFSLVTDRLNYVSALKLSETMQDGERKEKLQKALKIGLLVQEEKVDAAVDELLGLEDTVAFQWARQCFRLSLCDDRGEVDVDSLIGLMMEKKYFDAAEKMIKRWIPVASHQQDRWLTNLEQLRNKEKS